MRGYKYVKFSKRTAIINPVMVSDAYKKLVNQKEEEIKPLDVVKFKINGRSAQHIRTVTSNNFNETEMDIDIKCDDLISLYKKVINTQQILLTLKNELSDIKSEHERFKTRFLHRDI